MEAEKGVENDHSSRYAPCTQPCNPDEDEAGVGNVKSSVFVFKVTLAGARSVWRRIAVRGNQTLDYLHEAIFQAFDRDDEHMYSFFFPRPGCKGRASLRGAEEYTHPFNAAHPGPFADKPLNNAGTARLSALGLKAGSTFLYLFDFGDEWWHKITLEKTDAPDDGGRYPRILEKRGDSPPQYPDLEDDVIEWDDAVVLYTTGAQPALPAAPSG
jgi:hypothetical protein